MFQFLSPIDVVSSIALLVLALFGLVELILAAKHYYYLNTKHLSILHVDSAVVGDKPESFIKSIKPPFTFEIAIHHLGKDVHYYLVVPRKRAASLVAYNGIAEVEDYGLFHHGGEHLGAYLKEGEWPGLDLGKIDFSRVNEIGEGVAVQIIFGRRRGRRTPANFRILVSAPSSYQAKEILAAIKSSLPGLNWIESLGDEFISQVNFREFSKKEAVYWGSA